MSTKTWLFSTASMVGLGEKLGTNRGSLSRAGGCVGSPSSREQWICSNLLMTLQKVAICGPREIRMILYHTRTERGKRVVCWSVLPCRVYIDSNRRDSRICVTACLWQSSHR
jgi:hypothetical protein